VPCKHWEPARTANMIDALIDALFCDLFAEREWRLHSRGLTAKPNYYPSTRVTTTIESVRVFPGTNVLAEHWCLNGDTMYVQ
jgi:hypothetical protein